MNGDKINKESLDSVAGGVISNDTSSMSIQGEQVVTVKNGRISRMDISDFKRVLINGGIPERDINSLLRMAAHNRNYSFDDAKSETGIDMSRII